MRSVRASTLPERSLLNAYAERGAFTDCYVTGIGHAVSLADYLEAFYTTPLFRIERWLLAVLIDRPSTDREAAELGAGTRQAFSAWVVESREAEQIVLAVGRTRSWLMVEATAGASAPATTLYFGSAIEPLRDVPEAGIGWQFRALSGFHAWYSRALLRAARRRLERQLDR
jgi:hypothetical protein